MKNTIFFDIDTQYDFMHKDGKLYVPHAEQIIPKLRKITEFALKKRIPIIASTDKHVMEDKEIASKAFPPHCIAETSGQKKISETYVQNAISVPNKLLPDNQIRHLIGKNLIIEKQEYDVFSNPNVKRLLKGIKKAYVYGVATDYCVKAAVLGLLSMGIETYVIKDAIMPVVKDNEHKDLDLMKQKGATFLTTDTLLDEL